MHVTACTHSLACYVAKRCRLNSAAADMQVRGTLTYKQQQEKCAARSRSVHEHLIKSSDFYGLLRAAACTCKGASGRQQSDHS